MDVSSEVVTDGQQTYEKMFHVTNQRSENQNHNENHLIPVRMTVIKKITSAGEDVQK